MFHAQTCKVWYHFTCLCYKNPLKTHIVQKIGQHVLNSMLGHVKIQDPELWGLENPTLNFQKHSLCLWLYHDLSGLGFQVIEKQIIAGACHTSTIL